MNRRDLMKSVAALSAVQVEARAAQVAAEATREPRQVIVILGESVRADMLNCYRNTGLKTPNLDRLAAGGVRFDKAYCVQPVCSPSRSAIWTGLHPHSNGMMGNSMAMGDTVHTVGQRLHDNGVHCALIGKWHIDGSDYFGTGRPAPGWDPDAWYDMRRYLQELSPEDRVRSRDPHTAEDPTWTAEMCFAHRCTNRAVDFLSKQKGKDFLLSVCYDEPHGPSLCPVEYSAMYKDFVFPESPNEADSLQGKPAEQTVWAESLGRMGQPPRPIKAAHFFGSHTFVDTETGRVLDAIDRYAPNALVIYTSDHGIFLDSHRLADKGAAMYEEITHIPFLARWPRHAPVNQTCPHTVSQIDLTGTLLEYFGMELPKTLEGGSMLSLIKDPARPLRSDAFIEWTRYEVDHDGFGGFQPIRCICDGRYKLSIHLMTSDELYDLQTDPGELRNLIGSTGHAATRNALHDRLLNHMDVSRDAFRCYYWGKRSWRPEFPVRWANAGMTRQQENDGYAPRELNYDTGLTMKAATRPKT